MALPPLISVIIPFYSRLSGLLARSVVSALNQTYPNVEVVVVDDCSPLEATNELKTFQDDRLKIVRLNQNGGGGVARNRGVTAAEGEFVAFLDYDDIWFEDKLARQYALFCELGARDSQVIYSQAEIIDGDSTFVRPVRAITKGELVGDYLFASKNLIQTSGIFLKKSLAQAAPFHDLKRHQDFQFCLSLEAAGATFHMLPSPSYQFVQIKKINDYQFSLWWLDQYHHLLSDKGCRGFEEVIVVRSMIHNRHWLRLISYCSSRRMVLIGFKATFFHMLKNGMPDSCVKFIRGL